MEKTTNPVLDLSDALADAVQALEPSLVRIPARRGSGTGIAWSPDTVVTSARVLGRRTEVPVVLPDGRSVQGSVRGRDFSRDLGLIVLPAGAPDLTVPAWQDPEDLRVGHLVLVLGRPGESVRATLGLVSALGGAWRARGASPVDAWIDVDASLPGGFPGGPLVDCSGAVIGINTRGLVPGGTTLPTSTVRRVAEELAAHGQIRRAWLGVGVKAVDLPETAGSNRGLLVISVAKNSPAEQAGVLLGDTLVSLGGAPVGSSEELLEALDRKAVGKSLGLVIFRAGALSELEITPGERPSSRRRC